MKYKLEEILDYEQPSKYIVHSTQYSDEYSLPVLTAGKSFILGYTNETDGICEASKEPVIIFDDFTGDTKYVDFDFKVKSSAMKILRVKNKTDSLRYIYFAMQNINFKPFSHKRLWLSEYSKLEINKGSKEEQEKIVSTLDDITKAIENRKTEIEYLQKLLHQKILEEIS